MIVEIIGNVVTHSKADFSQCWCMFMMQYYIWKNILHFSVIDSWVGIEETIKEAYPKPWENWAYYMSLALQQHRTANKEFWAWNGLFVCSEIVESTNSTMHIVSHKNYYEKSWQKITYDYNKSVFPWTLVNVEFNMNAIEKDISRLDDLLKRIETTEKDIEDFNYDDLR
jgi:hypothetical protein